MALSDKEILAQKKAGNIIIEPFIDKHLATSSYDVRLGEWYYREQEPKHFRTLYNPWNEKDVHSVWGKPERAQRAKDVFTEGTLLSGEGLSPHDLIIPIRPGETILAHTEEFIGGRNCITTMMKARSSLGRNFIEVCKCAGWGDVGYTNRWTMEITNNSRYYTIPLVVGRRVAQIVFFYTGNIRGVNYTSLGKYQETADLKMLKKKWNPKMMLPKLYKDREVSS